MHVNKIAWSAALLALTTTLASITTPAAAAAAPIAYNSDFNGDGYNDLAVGMPSYPAASGTSNTGQITVLYGGPDGFTGRSHLRPEPGCMLYSINTPCSGWGASMAAADTDGNGKTDLISSGYRSRQIHSWTSGNDTTRQIETGVSDMESLVFGLADHGDLRPDIVGMYRAGYVQGLGGWYNGGPFETSRLSPTRALSARSAAIGDIHGDGRLEMMWVGSDNSNGTGPYLWYSGDIRNPSPDPLVMGSPQACQAAPGTTKLACPQYDSKVTLGDVNGDGYRDLVMITPSTGTIDVWYGDKYGGGMYGVGFTSRDLSWLTPLSPSISSRIPSLATGDFNGDGAAEIAIGLPHAKVSGLDRAGAVALIPGSPTGPVVSRTQLITQDGIASPGSAPTADPVSEQSVADDTFGASVSIIDLTGDGKGELVAGAPGKNSGQGMLAVLPGTATGVPSAGQVVHAASVGLTEVGRFGYTLLH
ncbi:FG-GAP and VCBS repeat-containing protein [Nonomuraea sp. NPDC049758]|uniref:FG-GAP and VCBS repeat-containing protein n=1 Tax=Nonomuraea sp. NPDC049758 TaxID=3154360 RepID=UPI003442561C